MNNRVSLRAACGIRGSKASSDLTFAVPRMTPAAIYLINVHSGAPIVYIRPPQGKDHWPEDDQLILKIT